MDMLTETDSYISTNLPGCFNDLAAGQEIVLSKAFRRDQIAWIVLKHPRTRKERIFAIDWILPDPNHPFAVIRPAMVTNTLPQAPLTGLFLSQVSARLLEESELNHYLSHVASISELLNKPKVERERWALRPATHLLGELMEWTDLEPQPNWLDIDSEYFVDGVKLAQNDTVKIKHRMRYRDSFHLYLSRINAMDTDQKFVAHWLNGNMEETFLVLELPLEQIEGLDLNRFLIFEVVDENTLRVPSQSKICEQARSWFDSAEQGRLPAVADDIQRVFGPFYDNTSI